RGERAEVERTLELARIAGDLDRRTARANGARAAVGRAVQADATVVGEARPRAVDVFQADDRAAIDAARDRAVSVLNQPNLDEARLAEDAAVGVDREIRAARHRVARISGT